MSLGPSECDSAVPITPLSLTLLCQWHSWAWLPGANNTTEPDSVVSVTPLILTPQSQWHIWAWLCPVNNTTESDKMVSMTQRNSFITWEYLPLIQTSWVTLSYSIRKTRLFFFKVQLKIFIITIMCFYCNLRKQDNYLKQGDT